MMREETDEEIVREAIGVAENAAPRRRPVRQAQVTRLEQIASEAGVHPDWMRNWLRREIAKRRAANTTLPAINGDTHVPQRSRPPVSERPATSKHQSTQPNPHSSPDLDAAA